MTELKYDPRVSSQAYLLKAREHHLQNIGLKPHKELRILDEIEGFDFDIRSQNVAALSDPANWSEAVCASSEKPRVYIDSYFNQSGNLEVRAIGGQHGIIVWEDFASDYVRYALQAPRGDYRSPGELMWISGLHRLLALAQHNISARLLVFGYRSRLSELVSSLSETLAVLGSDRLEFGYSDDNYLDFRIASTLSDDELAYMKRLWTGYL